MKLTLDSWVTSDQHWSHKNIREYQDRPDDHFERMRRLWIERVREDEIILNLGDLVCYGDRSRHPDWIEGLPGEKYLILGNHDEHGRAWYEAAGFVVLGRGNRPYLWAAPDGTIIAFSHEPLTWRLGHENAGFWDVNVHGHIHNNPLWNPLPDKRYVNACVEQTDYAPIRLRDLLSR